MSPATLETRPGVDSGVSVGSPSSDFEEHAYDQLAASIRKQEEIAQLRNAMRESRQFKTSTVEPSDTLEIGGPGISRSLPNLELGGWNFSSPDPILKDPLRVVTFRSFQGEEKTRWVRINHQLDRRIFNPAALK